MSQLASSSLDNSVMIWNFKPQLRAFRFVGHKGPVTGLDFANTGKVLASSSRDCTVRLWTPNVKGDVVVFKAHTSTVRNVQFSSDSEQLLTCSDDKTLKLWSTHRTKFQYSLTGHLNWVRSAKFSPDNRIVLSGSDDKTIKLWDLNSKSCIKTYWDHTGVVTSVAFHPSGTIVATGSMDRSIKLFDTRTHKLIQHYGDAHGSNAASLDNSINVGGVNSVCFGGDNGEWLISTGMDGVVKVWDVKEGHLFYTLHGHKNGPTTAAVFSPQSDFFATGGSDSQVMVWKSNFDQIDRIHVSDQEVFKPVKNSSPTHETVRTKSPVSPQRVFVDQEPIQLGAPIISDVGYMDAAPTPDTVKEDPKETRTALEPKLYAKSPLQVQTIPDQVASALSHISRQMDILTQTMSILENRLTLNEDRLNELNQKFDQAFKSEKKETYSVQPKVSKIEPRSVVENIRETSRPASVQEVSPATKVYEQNVEEIYAS